MRSSKHPLLDLVKTHKSGEPVGITSICSANPFVLESSINFAAQRRSLLCIEATCNQVNQYGGYTGLRPAQFVRLVQDIADKEGLPPGLMVLGGDHLGPFPWRKEAAATAMQKAKELVRDYVRAGFTKIHLDASMNLADDPKDKALPITLAAVRSAELCAVAERASQQMGQGDTLCYIIGTEVPIPGGNQGYQEEVHISSVESTAETILATKEAFREFGLSGAWERVAAVVVHPGVEFDSYQVSTYTREKVRSLSEYIKNSSHMVFEAHSTDYQTEKMLRQMVEDHFVILKVGPELTFAYREGIFILAQIEREYYRLNTKIKLSNIEQIIDNVMLEQPEHWESYYSGNKDEQTFARKFSFSDRIRYYWSVPIIKEALHQLYTNLDNAIIPLPLLSQYLPQYYQKLREENLFFTPRDFVKAHIKGVLTKYKIACNCRFNS